MKAVLTKEVPNKFGQLLRSGMEFTVEAISGSDYRYRVRFSCEELYFASRQEMQDFGLKLYEEEESPLEVRLKEFPVELSIGLHEGDGIPRSCIPALPDAYGIKFYGNISKVFVKSSDVVVAVLDRGAEIVEFRTPRIYWGGSTAESTNYSHGSGDGFMSPGYD